MAKKKDAKRKLEEGLQELSKLNPEDRIDIYDQIAHINMHSTCNNAVFNFDSFNRKNVEISDDGFVVW